MLVPPPPPPADETHPWSRLPPGWTTTISRVDGRIYYWNQETGQASWTHPLAPVDQNPTLAPQQPPLFENDPLHPNRTRASRWRSPQYWRTWGNGPTDGMSRTEWWDTPLNASRRPENHQCYAVTALLLFFPVGFCACYHSWQVDRSWRYGRYGDAVNHSRQASNYACLGTFLGILAWAIWFLFRKIHFDWHNFNFGNFGGG